MKKSAILLLISCLLSANIVFAQEPASLVYEGLLTDIEGKALTNTKVGLDITMTLANKKVLFESSEETSTDATGVFQVSAPDIPAFDAAAGKVTLELTLKPAPGSSWMDEKSFSLKYYLQKKDADFSMTRAEGHNLYVETTKPVWFFKDSSPYGYLSSTFMISFSKDISDPEDIILICSKMKGREKLAPEQPATRGAKGGYAVGGYKKK